VELLVARLLVVAASGSSSDLVEQPLDVADELPEPPVVGSKAPGDGLESVEREALREIAY
jgi:hypothetical protein